MKRHLSIARARNEPRLLEAILRGNFEMFGRKVFNHLNPGTEFQPNWHIKSIYWHLDQIRIATFNRLIITMPPRSGKSIAASVALPAFIHGHDPSRHIICVSYAQELATKLHNDYRSAIRSEWYRRLFPKVSPRKENESRIELTGGGTRIATSVGGVLTGLGADVIIIDDPLKASDAYSEPSRTALNDWYGGSLVSRLNQKTKGAIVIVSQRLHMDDLIGHVRSRDRSWEFLQLPAIASEDRRISIGDDLYHLYQKGEVLHPEREPLKELERLRRDIGSDAFAAQYLQEPVPPGGNMFKRSWVKRYRHDPLQEPGDEILQSWDTASKDGPQNDWSVCTTWLRRGGIYYLLDVFRDRVDYPTLRTRALALGRKHSPRMILIEECGVGAALVTELRRKGMNVRPVKPNTSKEARASVQASKFEGGRVYFPDSAPWLEELEGELFAFPGGRHDDQVDSVTQALAYDVPRSRTTVSAVGIY